VNKRLQSTVVVLFTRDLRVHDNPALAAAVERFERVLPLFVLDGELLESFGAPNRVAFLLDSLRDLGGSLRTRGGELVLRRGDVVAETVRAARGARAERVFLSEDVSRYAQRRERRLRRALAAERIELETFPGATVVPPGDLAPAGGQAFRVFTPYWRRWRVEPRRPALPAPERIALPGGVARGTLPELRELVPGLPAPELPRGGETAGRERLARWLEHGLARYDELRDDLAADATSRLSPYLHLGCVSPGEVVERALGREGGEAFVRQLCWRDFHHQLLAATPALAREDFRPRSAGWRDDPEALEAWKQGRTGYSLVDAGMRQLVREGFMHNRARLVAGSFLTKHLSIDWREGAAHFYDHLVDGDVACNAGNWQWVAGTGTDTRPNRMLNPIRQAQRFDPEGLYARRYLPELGTAEYPEPLVEHEAAVARFRGAVAR
jgi:deoxyribodipyrimidine photo-lyase